MQITVEKFYDFGTIPQRDIRFYKVFQCLVLSVISPSKKMQSFCKFSQHVEEMHIKSNLYVSNKVFIGEIT